MPHGPELLKGCTVEHCMKDNHYPKGGIEAHQSCHAGKFSTTNRIDKQKCKKRLPQAVRCYFGHQCQNMGRVQSPSFVDIPKSKKCLL